MGHRATTRKRRVKVSDATWDDAAIGAPKSRTVFQLNMRIQTAKIRQEQTGDLAAEDLGQLGPV